MPKCKNNEMNEADPAWEESCGNVFKDLGYSDDEAANLAVRSHLMVILKQMIKEKAWTQHEAARRLGVRQPRVSDLLNGHIDKFSVDMLMSWLHKLGKEVTVLVNDKEVA